MKIVTQIIVLYVLSQSFIFSQYYIIYSSANTWESINKIEIIESDFIFYQKPIYTNESMKFTLSIDQIDSIEYQAPIPGYTQPKICYWTCGLSLLAGVYAFSRPADLDECSNIIDCMFTRFGEFGDRTDKIVRTAEIGLLTGLVIWGLHEYKSNKVEIEPIQYYLYNIPIDEKMIILGQIVTEYNLRKEMEKKDVAEFFLY